MPRRPLSNRRCLKRLPVTFSPFSHSISALASNQMFNRRRSASDSAGNKFSKHKLLEKRELSESSEDEEFDGVVQADFVFFDPKPDDFHGVKILLKTYLDDKEWDLSGFVDLILAQTTVGTMIKIEGDEDDSPYSVITVLNLGRYKDCKCIMDLKEYLLKVCQEKDEISSLRSLLGERAQEVGLLVSQRAVNLPPQLLPPLYNALFDEVSWATEDEPTNELRDSFCFKFYLLVSKIYKHKNASQKRNSIPKKKKPSSHSDEEIIYVKPEDEIFYQLSSWSFSFPLHNQQVETNELKNYHLMGLVMAVEAEKVSTFRQQLKSLVDES